VTDRPTDRDRNAASRRPTVSVIVPARNEEASLGACLESLVRQKDIAFEIIVVDDHSIDRTREIALSFLNSLVQVRVIEAQPLPTGWTGKNNALACGVKASRGLWLLFTDADTVHLPGSLARSLEEAERRCAAMLSYSPEQIVKSFWEKAVMPVIFAELAANYRPSQVSDPKSPIAAANGQYILITREAYETVGGHAAVAGNLLEDVALARAVKHSGRKIFFRYGGDAVQTHMYRNFSQLCEGWTKNLSLLFYSPLRLALLRTLEFVLISSTFAIAAIAALRGHWHAGVAPVILFTSLYALFLGRICKAHFSWGTSLFVFFGLPVFSYLLLRSKHFYERGVVSWKGRTYSGKGSILSTMASQTNSIVTSDREKESKGLLQAS
jgi:glycosyltransferase involved in cell wall biosynthesis